MGPWELIKGQSAVSYLRAEGFPFSLTIMYCPIHPCACPFTGASEVEMNHAWPLPQGSSQPSEQIETHRERKYTQLDLAERLWAVRRGSCLWLWDQRRPSGGGHAFIMPSIMPCIHSFTHSFLSPYCARLRVGCQGHSSKHIRHILCLHGVSIRI